ncbi:hypothetical protein V5799_012050 [Amblyomma americanum]|uniref:Chitin-binding type-2 domain-containing protein n=1 Tax=Amblyomma americanum TaxID=6943 RepID=A0AAQ4EFG9_AMBAM
MEDQRALEDVRSGSRAGIRRDPLRAPLPRRGRRLAHRHLGQERASVRGSAAAATSMTVPPTAAAAPRPLLPLLLLLLALSPGAGGDAQRGSPLLLPDVKFSCRGRATGYYADVELRCSVFHYCGPEADRYSFVCPPKSTFNQRLLMCDYEPGAAELCPHSESYYNVTTATSSTTPRVRKPVTRPPTTTTEPPTTVPPTTVAVFGKPRVTTPAVSSDEDEWLDDDGGNETAAVNETRWSQPVQQDEGGWLPSEPFDRQALFESLHESGVTYEEPRSSGDSGANSFVVYDPSELGRPFYYQPEPAGYELSDEPPRSSYEQSMGPPRPSYEQSMEPPRPSYEQPMEPPRPPWQPMAQVLLGRPDGSYHKTPSGYFEFRHRASRRRARSTRVKRQLLLSRFFKRQPLRPPPPPREEEWLPSVHFPLKSFFPVVHEPAWPPFRLPPPKGAAAAPPPFRGPRPSRPMHVFGGGRPPMPHPENFMPPFNPEMRPWSQLGVSYLPESMFVPAHVMHNSGPPPPTSPPLTEPPPMRPPLLTHPPMRPPMTHPPMPHPSMTRSPVSRSPPRKKPSRRRRPTPTRAPPTSTPFTKENRTYSWYGGWTTMPPRATPARPQRPTQLTPFVPTLPPRAPTQPKPLPPSTQPRPPPPTTSAKPKPAQSRPASPKSTATLKLSGTTPFSWERLRTTTARPSTTPRPATVVRVFSNKIGSSVMATAGTPRTTTARPSTAADVKDNVIGNGRDRGFPFEFFTDINKLLERSTPQPQPVYKPPTASREPVTEVVTAISFSESAPAAA